MLRVAYQEEGRADQAARGPQDRVGKPQGNHFVHSISRIRDDRYSAKQEMLIPRLIQRTPGSVSRVKRGIHK